MSLLVTKIYTFFYGKKMGEDEHGNKYYYAKPRRHWWQINRCSPNKWGRDRRWVMYSKEFKKLGTEPSAVPPEWNIWLHHVETEPLNAGERHQWQKEPIANPTGTKDAIYPKGLSKGEKRQKAAQDFEAWVPNS
ncbi:MAG: NADH-ubiquinone oxidoreductase subunit NDUFA12 family protein [Alphaproteobacteria bacterium]